MNMKKIIAFAIVLLGTLSLCQASPATLYRNGKAKYVIVFSKNALPAEKTAVHELCSYLEQITGTAPKAYYDDELEPGKNEIVVGRTNRENSDFQIDRSRVSEEGIIIQWHGSSVFITSQAKDFGRGTLYSAYEFLRQLGCEFYAKDTETVPSAKTLQIERKDIFEDSPFEHRETYWSCSFDEKLSAKLRLNGSLSTYSRNIGPAYGGMRSYTANKSVHTFYKLIPPEIYFKDHPEYYAEINGERTCKHLYSQLCMSNPEVVKLAIEKVKEWIREDPDSRIISVSQNDSFVLESYCTCEECRRINEEEGSPAGALLRFTNAIADGIKDEFPDVAIDMLAYQYSVTPPKKTVPRDNVIVRYCTGGCYPHPIEECENNAGAKNCLTNWSKICDRLYVWDYTTNFAQYFCPIANFYSLKPNLQFFRDHGVKGVFEQGMYQNGESGEFGDLRAYVLAKLMWNPEQDLETLIDSFMAAFYGPGAKYVREYFDLLHKRVLDSGIHFGPAFACSDRFKDIFSDEDLKHLDEVWKAAVEACEPGSKERTHVERSQISYRFYKLDCRRGEFASDFDKENEKFNVDCHRLGVERFNEGVNIPPVNVK